MEILCLIRSLRNRLAPVNRIPPEVLTLIPDLLGVYFRDRSLIALTHVCRAWREIFISCSSLWSNLACVDADKTRVYLERSRSSPINLQLNRDVGLSSLDPFLQITPQAIGRLKSLIVEATPENRQAIIAHLSHPAPLLERLDIDGGFPYPSQHVPVITSTIFAGDLSSLRVLYLDTVHTELPWRNMTNLMSFTLCNNLAGDLSIGQLLDFLQSAPRLRKIILYGATLVSGGENGRLISLDHLKRMDIRYCGPTSILLDHLVIPVGARLTTQPRSFHSMIEDHIPRSLDNLKNLSGFTKIHIHDLSPHLRLSGPNGRFSVVVGHTENPDLVLESLARFDTSKTERLQIYSRIGLSGGTFYRTLLPMDNLRTLIFSLRSKLCILTDALNPNKSLSRKVVCPLLEELIFVSCLGGPEFNSVIDMAAARALRGVKLKSVMVNDDEDQFYPADVLELKKHVLHAEYSTIAIDVDDDDGNEEDY